MGAKSPPPLYVFGFELRRPWISGLLSGRTPDCLAGPRYFNDLFSQKCLFSVTVLLFILKIVKFTFQEMQKVFC